VSLYATLYTHVEISKKKKNRKKKLKRNKKETKKKNVLGVGALQYLIQHT
jgi:hypothetical protein